MKVGSKVVLVNNIWDKLNWCYGKVTLPVLGEIYTVRGIKETGNSIYLEEIVNPYFLYADGVSGFEVSWFTWRFVELMPPAEEEETFELQETNYT